MVVARFPLAEREGAIVGVNVDFLIDSICILLLLSASREKKGRGKTSNKMVEWLNHDLLVVHRDRDRRGGRHLLT